MSSLKENYRRVTGRFSALIVESSVRKYQQSRAVDLGTCSHNKPVSCSELLKDDAIQIAEAGGSGLGVVYGAWAKHLDRCAGVRGCSREQAARLTREGVVKTLFPKVFAACAALGLMTSGGCPGGDDYIGDFGGRGTQKTL